MALLANIPFDRRLYGDAHRRSIPDEYRVGTALRDFLQCSGCCDAPEVRRREALGIITDMQQQNKVWSLDEGTKQ
jgi:hypothetical protein